MIDTSTILMLILSENGKSPVPIFWGFSTHITFARKGFRLITC